MSESNSASAATIKTQYDIQNKEGLEFLEGLKNNSIDLILTDPPYIISQESGMNQHHQLAKQQDKSNTNLKTEEDWEKFKEQTEAKHKKEHKVEYTETEKKNFLKYGTHLGKKYATKTDYGEWDSNFTMETLDKFICEYYKKLRKGGTLIMFFDIWKLSYLKELFEKNKFKQIRFIEWIKTNPQPLNQKVNYLTNCREIALVGVKGGKPTFHSKYDNGIYKYPLQSGKKRFHPTQKSIQLFEALIEKHSNEGDVVVDTLVGGGTTAIACKNKNRNFKGCEISKEYYDKIMDLFKE